MPASSPPTCSPFFKSVKHSRDWSFAEYLKYDHGASLAPRRIIDSWSKSLIYITKCSDKEFSHVHRKRAAELLKRYKEKGKGSDKAYGQEWLAEKRGKSNSAGVAAAPINIGALFQGPVSNSSVPITQSSSQTVTPAQRVPREDGVAEVSDEERVATPAGTDISEDEASDDEDQRPIKLERPISPLDKIPPISSSFTQSWKDMVPSHKWHLSSGRNVEDIIYTACLSMDSTSFANSLAHCFVLDTSDNRMKSWFQPGEWSEICSSISLLPKPDLILAQSMKRFFGIKSVGALRDVLNKEGYLKEGEKYDPEIHYNAQWADVVFRRFLMLLEAPGEPLRTAHLEDWYSGYIWSSILDDCLLNLPRMTVERKESPCRASSIRKNRNRTNHKSTRMKIGARLDAIIRTVEDDYYEYGGMEVARTFVGGNTSTKWLGDSFKLARALRDMVVRLHGLVGDGDGEAEVDARRKIQVVGVTTAGLAFQYARMSNPGGYVCLLQRERMQVVPKSIGSLPELMKLLMSVAQMKQVVRDCASTVEDRHASKSEADLYNELLGGGGGGSSSSRDTAAAAAAGGGGAEPGIVIGAGAGTRVTPDRTNSPKLPWTLDTP